MNTKFLKQLNPLTKIILTLLVLSVAGKLTYSYLAQPLLTARIGTNPISHTVTPNQNNNIHWQALINNININLLANSINIQVAPISTNNTNNTDNYVIHNPNRKRPTPAYDAEVPGPTNISCSTDADCPTNHSCRTTPWRGCPITYKYDDTTKTNIAVSTGCAHPPVCYPNPQYPIRSPQPTITPNPTPTELLTFNPLNKKLAISTNSQQQKLINLDIAWMEHNVPMLLRFIIKTLDNNNHSFKWNIVDIQTYDGTPEKNLVSFKNTDNKDSLFDTYSVESTFLDLPNIHSYSINYNNKHYTINFQDLKLILSNTKPSPSPVPSHSPLPTITPDPHDSSVSLEMSPPPTLFFDSTQNNTKTYNINAHPDNNVSLTAVQLELLYDPKLIKISNLHPTSYLPITLSKPKYEPGKVTATFAINPESGSRGQNSWGTVATLDLTPIKATNHTTISFGPNTKATVLNFNQNALKPLLIENIKIYYLGDLNGNGVVDIFDYNLFITKYGQTGYSSADLNKDNIVDIFDYNIFIHNYNKSINLK